MHGKSRKSSESFVKVSLSIWNAFAFIQCIFLLISTLLSAFFFEYEVLPIHFREGPRRHCIWIATIPLTNASLATCKCICLWFSTIIFIEYFISYTRVSFINIPVLRANFKLNVEVATIPTEQFI